MNAARSFSVNPAKALSLTVLTAASTALTLFRATGVREISELRPSWGVRPAVDQAVPLHSRQGGCHRRLFDRREAGKGCLRSRQREKHRKISGGDGCAAIRGVIRAITTRRPEDSHIYLAGKSARSGAISRCRARRRLAKVASFAE